MLNLHAASKRSVEDNPGDNEPKPLASKRQKRGKYVSRACDQCQQRKIKCDGSLPCAPCALNRRDCGKQTTDMRRRSARTQVEAGQGRYSTVVEGQHSYNDNQELLSRMDQLERLVQVKLQALVSNRGEHEQSGPEEARPITTPRQERLAHVQPTAYSGETSIPYTLNQLEVNLARLGGPEPSTADTLSRTATPALTPAPSPSGGVASCRVLDIHKFLDRYGIEASKSHWDKYLYTFCDSVHSMYPFLHLPSLWHQYADIWEIWFLESPKPGIVDSRDKHIMVAQLFMCLAIGQCTASPRVAGAEARYSAGWSLYTAATDLCGNILNTFDECSDQILVLQNLALMVVYLFRLDIIGKAEKLLALAISHAHYLGIHRCKIKMNGLKQIEVEICRRLWWCLYIMDRRLAVDTGRPFLIQDLNSDTPLPQDLDDDHVHYHQADWNVSPGSDLQTETPTGVATPIPYLTAMVTYSRVLGKVWEGIYSAKDTETPPSPQICEYLECLISRVQKDIPREFVYHPWQREDEIKPSVWWLARQRTLMQVRWLSLRLLIRRPMLRETPSFPAHELTGTENEVICALIARESIKKCLEIPLEQTVFTYPFLHYLIIAAIVSIGLMIKESLYKDQYGDITLHAIQVLEAYCHRTWVSGKLIRIVLKLSKILSQVLASSNHPHEQQASCLFSGKDCAMKQLDGTRRSFSTAHLGTKHTEQLFEPSHNEVADSQTLGLLDTAPPCVQSAGLTSLYSEENGMNRAASSQLPTQVETPAPTGWQLDSADTEEGVAREMQWLEALFGSYLDSNLIIRPGE